MNNTVNLSKRLKETASFVPPGIRFADIGSDHAYLPSYICLSDLTAQAIAGEVNEGPFQRARETVSFYNLSDRIDVRLGNGLKVFSPGEVDAVVIAGMGGSLIRAILEHGSDRMAGTKRIIAQPNTDERDVRKWFSTHGYVIMDEVLLEENGHIYEIIVGDKHTGRQQLTGKQLLFGPRLLQQKSDLFYQKWEQERKKRHRIIEQMKHAKVPEAAKIASFEKELLWIKEEVEDDCP
ncbi:tRNA (adenine(22)-N(1))-methyltransferase [Lentibacillus juripiscarius]|uniref:tRNA (Adenine(22)-N(1))-methyltransferase n=1 Tax=Lentibacillus juripiscarius TaxID=257446 RepID=A0ABW5V466_9BACI